MVYRNPGI